MGENKMKHWYCYVCGKKLPTAYCLCSLNNSTDRVFLCCKKCVERLDSETIIIEVKETK